MRSVKRSMCAAILVLQAIVLGLTTPVMISVESVATSTALLVGVGLAVACIVTAGVLGRPWAYGLGWVIQVASLALGVVVTMMFFLGAVFASLWAAAYFLGEKIEREKAERAVIEAEWEAEQNGR